MLTLEQQMLALPGLVAYWPLNETTGTTADNAEGTAARDGAYTGTITLNNAVFPAGGNAPLFTNGYVDVYNAAINSIFNGNSGWLLHWIKPTNWDITTRQASIMYRSTSGHYIFVQLETDYVTQILRSAGGNRLASLGMDSVNWQMIAVTWNGGTMQHIHNGTVRATNTTLGTWTGDLDETKAEGIGKYGTYAFVGNIAHTALGAVSIPTLAQFNAIYEAVYPDSREIFFCGDSKATADDTWPNHLIDNLETATGDVWRERPGRIGLSGQRVAALHTNLDANLPSLVGNPELCLVNIGTNDLVAPATTEASFKADLVGCIDALQGKWSTADIYITKPWRGDADYDAAALAMAGWIDDVVALYAGNVYAGTDENGWFKTGVATYSADNIHYNEAGCEEAASQWETVLGY